METHLWDYSRLLAARGIDVTVFTGTPEAVVPLQPGVTVRYHSDLDLSPYSRRPVGEPPLSTWFRKWLRADVAAGRSGIRLVHGHNLHHFSDRPARTLNELRDELGLRLVHTYHSVWHGESRNPAADACRGWDRHFAVSEFLSASCASELCVGAERRYLGINVAAYRDVPVSGGGQQPGLVLLPARLIPDKGAELAIRAMHQIIGHEMSQVRPQLVLMDTQKTVDFRGERKGFREMLEEEIDRLRIRPYVEFVEAGAQQMRNLYEAASVVIYPSVFAEPMGLAPLEAMCAARPVVVTRIGGLEEGVVDDGEIGYLVPDRNVDKLADRIALLLDSPELARNVGLRARRHSLDHFDLEHYAGPMINEYMRQLDDGDCGTSPL
ncbi:glycosyltransferase family 4 protein [Streptomyces sp. NPDC051576]|uniref:glycosyltransferase family 4 protein n=1 Tax=Streptomyces sp. NPDC051576 TaxID=3155803 RepID=UPI003446E7E0